MLIRAHEQRETSALMSKFFSKYQLCPGLSADPNPAGLNKQPILTSAFVPSVLHFPSFQLLAVTGMTGIPPGPPDVKVEVCAPSLCCTSLSDAQQLSHPPCPTEVGRKNNRFASLRTAAVTDEDSCNKSAKALTAALTTQSVRADGWLRRRHTQACKHASCSRQTGRKQTTAASWAVLSTKLLPAAPDRP